MHMKKSTRVRITHEEIHRAWIAHQEIHKGVRCAWRSPRTRGPHMKKSMRVRDAHKEAHAQPVHMTFPKISCLTVGLSLSTWYLDCILVSCAIGHSLHYLDMCIELTNFLLKTHQPTCMRIIFVTLDLNSSGRSHASRLRHHIASASPCSTSLCQRDETGMFRLVLKWTVKNLAKPKF